MLSACDCCEVGVPQTPANLANRPGLSAIHYRTGTYASFRQTMLSRIGGRVELAAWTSRDDQDYGVAVIDMWAYVADILSFYQERIANDAFLRTARQRESVVRLAALLDYKPAPGVAASTSLVFFVEPAKQVKIFTGLRVQSIPGQDEKPQKFEAIEEITAYGDLNLIRLKTTEATTLGAGAKDMVVRGSQTGLRQGDSVMVTGDLANWELRRVSGMPVVSSQGTRIHWEEGLPSAYGTGAKIVAFHQAAAPFGYNAPDYKTLPIAWRDPTTPVFPDWTNDTLATAAENTGYVYLDRAYPHVLAPSWLVAMTDGTTQVFPVTEVSDTTRTKYTLSGRVTRVKVDNPGGLSKFPLLKTSLLVQSEELTLADGLKPEVSGRSLELDGNYPELEHGRSLLLTGVRKDGSADVRLVHVDVPPSSAGGGPTLLLQESLDAYDPLSVRLYGNVAAATHGESIRPEVLGSGDASVAFQSFSLAKAPVTFVPKAGAPHGAADSLVLRVDGVEWQEVSTLYRRGANDRVYTAEVDPDGRLTTHFGDGVTGARLTTGRGNVVATYRKGIGRDGNVKADSLRTLLSRPVGLRSVTNPGAASGGARQETLEEARLNAPNTVRTFGRIVSLRDFEDAAREFSGVEKARAAWEWKPPEHVVHLTVAGFAGADLDGQALARLLADLDSRRDPNQKLLLDGGTKVAIALGAAIASDPAREEETVINAVQKAILDYFNWDRVNFGQSIHKSELYRVLREVDGVVAVRIYVLKYRSQSVAAAHLVDPALALLDDLPIYPTELPVLFPGFLELTTWGLSAIGDER